MRPAIAGLLLIALVGFDHDAQGQEADGGACLDCHGGSTGKDGAVSPSMLVANSVHTSLACTDCHESISMEEADARAHGDAVAPVVCGNCHEEEADEYTHKDRVEVGEDPDIPQCWSCHGAHDILSPANPKSRVHPINLPDTCRSCHTDIDLVKRHDNLRGEPIKLYENSVHARASKKGLYVSATCDDCHSAFGQDGKRTAHRVLSASDPESTVYHFNIPDTCGACHERVAKDYWDGIHGQRVRAGRVDAPVCTHCHGEHGIISPSDPRSPVSAARVAEATCAPCHESQVLNEKYGVPAGRLRSYIDSYHGLKSKAGDVHVANCASCHGAHRILPHTDPTSSIYVDNLKSTCGECHPGISAEIARTPIHETATGLKTGWPHFFTILYLWLIGVTIGSMVLHNFADWLRQVKNIQRKPSVKRLTTNEVLQHWLLMCSFIGLVISGFSLRFSESWWVRLLFGWGGGEGFVIRGKIHRVAATVFAICIVWHAVYLLGRRGRQMFWEMLPRTRDLVDLKDNVLYFVGVRTERPRFRRFSYVEKAEYWALAWGSAIMVATGVGLWFDNYFVERWDLPKGVLDVFLVVHYYEAWLASLAIVVWHLYGVMFSPSVYPMNTAWLLGRMSKDLYTHEHPEGPKLNACTFRAHYEDEEEPVEQMNSASADE